MRNLELKYRLPGTNTPGNNYSRWEAYNWNQKGEEWNFSQEWKDSLIENFIIKYFKPNKTILEIGPGAGRWTESLQNLANHLIIVDISPKCITLCKERFAAYDNIEYYVNTGTNLEFLSNTSIDYIWSFAVFVHINPLNTDLYLQEIQRVLKKGGIGIITHSTRGGIKGGWRSSVTDELFAALLKKNGLKILKQIHSWGKNRQFHVQLTEDGEINDTLTIFIK